MICNISIDDDLTFIADIELSNMGAIITIDDDVCMSYFYNWYIKIILSNGISKLYMRDICISFDGKQKILKGAFPHTISDNRISLSIDIISNVPIEQVRKNKLNKIGFNNR